jgi:hypothetical protein
VKRLLLAVLPLVVALVACAESGGSGGTPSELGTIHGIVLAGPTCPVERVGSPCPDRPMAGVEIAALLDGRVAGTAVSDSDGAFALHLPPGTYALKSVVEPEGPGLYSQPTSVVVKQGETVAATVLLDTGIRAPVGGG